MIITSFRIKNYKCFQDSGEVKLSAGFNVFVGQNNAGKTALLEALSLNFISKPHKSIASAPMPSTHLDTTSSANIAFSITGKELEEQLVNIRTFYLPAPQNDWPNGVKDFLASLPSISEISMNFDIKSSSGATSTFSATTWRGSQLPYNYKSTGQRHVIQVEYTKDHGFREQGVSANDGVDDFSITIADSFRRKIFCFKAERLNVETSTHGISDTLTPTASNLPEVLHTLQSTNPARFTRFNVFVRQVFPAIHRISVSSVDNAKVRISVWNDDPLMERPDLTIPLNECGTGVGQVLAILYVAITSEFPRTIIIDEPNSFLHPSASRKLIEILKTEFPQHQYIISTHSPEIINAAAPESLTLIHREGTQSVFKSLNARQVQDMQQCLMNLGAKLSDVFGADEILWVEGATEEECFKKNLQSSQKNACKNVSIVAVKNTGDFLGGSKKSKEMALAVHKKLSSGNFIIPKTIAIVFDKEDLSQTNVEDLSRAHSELLRFLPRRMYENYLIIPSALYAVMSGLETFKTESLSKEEIMGWIKKNGVDKKYFDKVPHITDIKNADWLVNVHGGELLKDLFCNLSCAKEEYRKTTHSILLTEWLVKNQPTALLDIETFLTECLTKRGSTG